MNETRQIRWTTKSGKSAIVKVEWVDTESIDLDGDRFETSIRPRIDIAADVAGRCFTGLNRKSVTVGGETYPAHSGKLLIPAAEMVRIDAEISEFESRDEWKTAEAADADNAKSNLAYENHAAKMQAIMGY